MQYGGDPFAVDVVIPVRDGARYIADCLRSAINQTKLARAIVVVDDGSTDRTATIVEDFKERWPAVRLVRTQKRGVSHARNIGIAHCEAPFVAFLDSDDLWDTTKLERQLTLFSTGGPTLGFVYCGYRHIDEAGRRLGKPSPMAPRKRNDLFRDLLIESNVLSGSCSAVVVRRTLLDQVGGFDQGMVFGEDWDLWIRLAANADVDFVREPLVSIRIHNESATRREMPDRERQVFCSALKVYGRWYNLGKLPKEAKRRCKMQAIQVATKSGFGPGVALTNTLKFFNELKHCEIRLGRELFHSPMDIVATFSIWPFFRVKRRCRALVIDLLMRLLLPQ